MIALLEEDLWQPCSRDVMVDACLPYETPADIKVYIQGQVTGVSLIDCLTNTPASVGLASFDYVVAHDGNGAVYTYLTNPNIVEMPNCFVIQLTVNGQSYYTPQWKSLSLCHRRSSIRMSSVFSRFDCLGRWYGSPQQPIAGNNSLVFSNEALVWGEMLRYSRRFEHARFGDCLVTKTRMVQPMEVVAYSVPPYFVDIVDGIIGRGIVTIDGETWQLEGGVAFNRIADICRTQYDMRVMGVSCECEIKHDCDSDFAFNGGCEGSLEYTCTGGRVDEFVQLPLTFLLEHDAGNFQLARVDMTGYPGLAGNLYNELDFLMNNGGFAFEFHTVAGSWFFYIPYMSNLQIVLDIVTWDYLWTAPSLNFGNVGCSWDWATNQMLPMGTSLPITADAGGTFYACVNATLAIQAIITGSSVLYTNWTVNVPYTQISDLEIAVPLPVTQNIEVSVDIQPEECGQLTLDVNIDGIADVQGRFMCAQADFFWNGVDKILTFSQVTHLVNNTVASHNWQVLNVGDGYSGADWVGTGDTFVINNIGTTDDFLVILTATDIYGRISVANMLFATGAGGVGSEMMVAVAKVNGFSNLNTEVTLDVWFGYITLYAGQMIGDIGVDFDDDNVYEQTTPSAAPVPLVHDYLAEGVYYGNVSLEIIDPIYGDVPFGFVRSKFVLELY